MKKYLTINDFLNDLPENKKIIVELLRSYILKSHPHLIENIKWNAANYVCDGQDRITFNTMNRNNAVRIILHKGAKEKEDKKLPPILDDKSGLISWNSNIRGTMEFATLQDAQNNQKLLIDIFKRWLLL